MLSFTAIVPCRANSKGLVDKNLRLVGGEPLWRRAVSQAQRLCHKVILSTDISEDRLSDIPEGVLLDKRPASLACDDTKMQDVIKYLISEYRLENETLILLQPTSPLRQDDDIIGAVNTYKSGNFSIVMSVIETDSKILKYGFLKQNQFLSVNNATYCFENRQNLPMIYAPNGAIYIFGGQAFMNMGSFPETNMGAFLMGEANSIDIDNLEDLERVEQFINTNLNSK